VSRELERALERALGAPVERAVKLAGGASKEAWAVDTGDGRRLLVRRAGGGVIHLDTLSLRDEFEVLVAAREAGVRVPEPVAYLGDVEGREAFAMERVAGETIGRRIVKMPPPGLAVQLAEELARIHAIPPGRLGFLPHGDLFGRLLEELDTVTEPHPAIEYGIAWCRSRLPLERQRVVSHGDFRIGNVAVDESGLVAVLDWEFARLADPLEDLAWPLIRAWRFGVDERRLGGIDDPQPYLERYAELTGLEAPLDELDVWEVLGNVKWAVGALTQSRRHLSGEEPSVELAILGRLSAEMEWELLDRIRRIEGRDPRDDAPPARGGEPAQGRPTAGELARAVQGFLEDEILPTLDDHRLRFRTLVAMNALGIVERESPSHRPPDAEAEELARRLRAGELGDDDLPRLVTAVEDELATVSPRFLERVARSERGAG
jgi:aminoglycoside phosphotransferase (APT) family kinase protein